MTDAVWNATTIVLEELARDEPDWDRVDAALSEALSEARKQRGAAMREASS